MVITICSSITFMPRYMKIKDDLEERGFKVLVPTLRMALPIEHGGGETSIRGFFEAQGGITNFPPEHEIWEHKADAIRAHFAKIDVAKSVLVTNFTKNGIENYIGGNTFLEMGYAFARGKKIYVLNPLPEFPYIKEELLGMKPTVINGDLAMIFW